MRISFRISLLNHGLSLFGLVIIFVGIHSCTIFRKHFVNFSHISSTSFKWSSFSFHAKGHSFLLFNTYRPEWTDSEYWARLNHAIGLAYQVYENIVIFGDLNSDLMSLNNNKLIDMMRLFSLKM
jgi:hypothetical protein